MAPYVVIALILLSIFCFHLLVGVIGVLRGPGTLRLLVLALVCLAGLFCGRRDLPLAFLAVAFMINFDCIIYLAGSWQTYTLGLDNGLLDSVWLPVMAGLLAFFRPALLLVPGIAIQWSKVALAGKIGGGISGNSDYIIVPDLAVLIAVFSAIYSSFQLLRLVIPHRWPVNMAGDRPALHSYFIGCVVAMAGIHLSNYFYSGWEKLFLLNAAPWTRVLENPTYLLAVHTQDFGFLTTPTVLGLSDDFYALLMIVNVPLNVAVLVAQLMAVGVLLSPRASTLLTIFYDLMHLAIFALTAIFFWKWVVLNAGFVLAFDTIRRHSPVVPKPVLLTGCVLVIAAPLLSFSITRLAWFDTPGVNDVHIEAITQAGETVRVPSNFFLNDSIGVAQQRFAGAFHGYLPTATRGTTGNAEVLHRLQQDCVAAASAWDLPAGAHDRIERLLVSHHAAAIALSADGSGRFAYDLYPHHIWSSPWGFGPFAALDLRTVSSYVPVVEGRCVTVEPDGRVVRTPVGISRHEFPVSAR
ncbi:hypothetical protein N8D56_01895 [Devosia sp. A8/3-2]|nr:hypothetical protein N8D56_01895 [Devosia sp. A8/3-2]